MNDVFLLSTAVLVGGFLLVVIVLLKHKKLYLKYALLWLLTGLVMLLLALFPGILGSVFKLLKIQVYSNGIFAILLFFFLVIMMSLTSIVSVQNSKIRRLTQESAILEKRVRELENEIKGTKDCG